jgi:hypothetical protein
MKSYKIQFTGRLKNAIGKTYSQTITVTAESEEAARLKIYDTHEHASNVKVKLLKP